jgi:hypothetical protein
MRQGARLVADLGAPDDGRYDPDGFWPREMIADTGLDLRWTREEASVAWAPVPGFVPARVVLRARAVAGPKDVSILVNGVLAGTLRVGTGLAETSTALSPAAARLLTGPECARIGIRTATEIPKTLGKGDDARALGVAVDRISLK